MRLSPVYLPHQCWQAETKSKKATNLVVICVNSINGNSQLPSCSSELHPRICEQQKVCCPDFLNQLHSFLVVWKERHNGLEMTLFVVKFRQRMFRKLPCFHTQGVLIVRS